jgi:hypothetical protein
MKLSALTTYRANMRVSRVENDFLALKGIKKGGKDCSNHPALFLALSKGH